MNNSTIHRLISSERIAIVACDVCKDSISAYAELGAESIEVVFSNKTRIIKESLKKSEHRALRAGYGKFTVVCEPAGVYHRPLFRIARQPGAETRQVSTEAVARMRIIETNDSGKTDIRDPRVIHTLAPVSAKHRNTGCLTETMNSCGNGIRYTMIRTLLLSGRNAPFIPC